MFMVKRVGFCRRVLALTLTGLASPAVAQGVERYASSGSAPAAILESARIPAHAETLMLSGVTASLPAAPDVPVTCETKVGDLGDTKTQTINILNHIRAALTRRGYSLSDVVRLTVFLVGDPAKGGRMDYAGMNEGYLQYFGTADNPARVTRATVQVVSLAQPAMLVEIEATAAHMPLRGQKSP